MKINLYNNKVILEIYFSKLPVFDSLIKIHFRRHGLYTFHAF